MKCSTQFGDIAFTNIKGKPWKTTQKYIDSIMQQMPNINEPRECSICCNMSIHFCSCAQCYHRQCTKCTVDIFKLNKGIIVCPYCNIKVGMRLLPQHVELVAAKMLSTMELNLQYTNMLCSPFIAILTKLWEKIPDINCKSACCSTINIIRRNTIEFCKDQRDIWKRGTSEP